VTDFGKTMDPKTAALNDGKTFKAIQRQLGTTVNDYHPNY